MNVYGAIAASLISLLLSFGATGQPKADSTGAVGAENLGNQVKSEYNEINPLISPDGKTLYFARISHPNNTHGAKGSQDIWYSERDAASGNWGPARPTALRLTVIRCS